MSRYKINRNEMATSCGPSKKQHKEELKYLKIAIIEVEDLIDSGYIRYDDCEAVYGNLMIRKRILIKQINLKKGK